MKTYVIVCERFGAVGNAQGHDPEEAAATWAEETDEGDVDPDEILPVVVWERASDSEMDAEDEDLADSVLNGDAEPPEGAVHLDLSWRPVWTARPPVDG